MSHCPFPIPGFPLPHRDDISRCWGRAGECWVWTEENIGLLPICNSGQFLAKLCHPLFSLLLCFSFYAPFTLFRSWPRAETILKLYISIKLSFFLLSDTLKILKRGLLCNFFPQGHRKHLLDGKYNLIICLRVWVELRKGSFKKLAEKENGGSWFTSPTWTPFFCFAAPVAILRGKPDCSLSYLKPLSGWSWCHLSPLSTSQPVPPVTLNYLQ